jgi:multidrug efflux pump subunit AcrB
LGQIAGAEKLTFSANIGPSPGAPVHVELQHDDMEVLERAAVQLAAAIRKFPETYDVDDGFAPGKPQLDMRLTPEAIGLDLSSADVARQVRSAFYGAEAMRQQEGRNEVRVTVRLPQAERRSLYDVETLMLRTPRGGEIPLQEAADIAPGRSRPTILRAEGKRMIGVSAQVRPDTSPDSVLAAIESGPVKQLMAEHPGLTYDFGGAQREQKKAMGSLFRGGALAILAIFALLAIPFRSYLQPAIVMMAIPFGFVGALIGHVVMGFELSMISAMGLIALAGVVVNDSLVLIDAANGYRREGQTAEQAIRSAGMRRFRPILLTSVTTFGGLIPMIAETSVQAQFLVPMAISLGFGVMFATFITLLLIPVFYLMLEDVKRALHIRDSADTNAPLSTDSLTQPVVDPGE